MPAAWQVARRQDRFTPTPFLGYIGRVTKTYHFRYCWVHSSDGYTETVFHDGTKVTAVPEDTDEYRANAQNLGYGSDIAALSREHEILHTFLAERWRDTGSPALWAVAHGQQGAIAPRWVQEEEEAEVLAFQALLNGGPINDVLKRLMEYGMDVEALRDEALRLLR